MQRQGLLCIDYGGKLSGVQMNAALFAAIRYMQEKQSGSKRFEGSGVTGTIRHEGRYTFGVYRGERFTLEFDSLAGDDPYYEGLLEDVLLETRIPPSAVVFRPVRKKAGQTVH